ncbi:FecR family protein [Algoriphagus resistens]|uniref:FecR family protein n=1 Tax=Algoriphagus resistens TaxID=1750590 RepID=UPI000716C736|nr:FecR domain-containing protein [Algoriphagus resistens]
MNHHKRIKDFFEGNLTKEEAQEFLDFLESKEAEEFLTADMIQLWSDKLKSGEYNWDNKALWEKLNHNKSNYARPYVQRDSIRKRNWLPWTRAAAVFIAIGLSTLFFVNRDKYKADQEQELLLDTKLITHYNPAGKKTRITLPDGSTVFLNSESKLVYPADFQRDRSVSLEGEGFFEVTKDTEHPFKVESNGIVTTALGTSFNISTFEPDDKVAVTLLTGKVELRQKGKGKAIQLIPGEESVLSKFDENLNKKTVDALDMILWTQGVLKLNDTGFDQLTAILERWYDVEITVQGSGTKLLARGTFDSNESLRNVLTVLGESMNFSYELNDKKVLIKLN